MPLLPPAAARGTELGCWYSYFYKYGAPTELKQRSNFVYSVFSKHKNLCYSSMESIARKASCFISTEPTCFIRFSNYHIPAKAGIQMLIRYKLYTLFSSLTPKNYSSIESIARKASCGIWTEPTCFIRFFPSFCFSSSFLFLEISPP